MSLFETYFILGLQHILDWKGYDHMVFLLALLAPISVKHWKKILLLITAFTIGHSISLALSTMQLISADAAFIELLIPITILITAISNVVIYQHLGKIHYGITILFGLIHGMGFSGYLRSLLGREEDIFTPLLSFNLGLELGQIIFTIAIISIVAISNNYLSVKQRTLNLVLSGVAGAISIFLIIERI